MYCPPPCWKHLRCHGVLLRSREYLPYLLEKRRRQIDCGAVVSFPVERENRTEASGGAQRFPAPAFSYNHYNRPFPSCCEPRYQNEAECKAFHMKISFDE